MRKSTQFLAGGLTALAMLVIPTARAEAAFIVNTGIVGGSGDVSNVISNACDGTITGSPTPVSLVQGCLQSDESVFVNFESLTDLLTITGGQASLFADDGIINQLTISLDSGGTFEKLILDLQHTNNTDATVTFDADPNSGEGPYVFNLTNGSNFFTITGESFNSVSFSSVVGISVLNLEVKQVRLGGGDITPDPDPDPLPEPTTMALFGLGLLGAGIARRRRQ